MHKEQESKWWNIITLANPGLYLFTRDKLSKESGRSWDMAMAMIGLVVLSGFVVFLIYLLVQSIS